MNGVFKRREFCDSLNDSTVAWTQFANSE